MLAACDIYRPAAIDQLEIVGQQVGVPVYSDRNNRDAAAIAVAAKREAERRGLNILIIDTAGRLHIDEELMEELRRIRKEIKPHEILLVVDAMTGQDAVNVAETFHNQLGIDGIIMTKLDGDTRGGAALSVKAVTGRPIKFAGMGEKLDALEVFHPDRMASRILGMGDVMTLIEKAQESADLEKAADLEKRLARNKFTLEDFLDQIGQIRGMGGLGKLIDMIPGGNKVSGEQLDQGEQEFRRMEAIMQSMTKAERQDPTLLNASRRKRIAEGSGTSVTQVNQLIKKYEEAKKLLKQFNSGKFGKRGRKFGFR